MTNVKDGGPFAPTAMHAVGCSDFIDGKGGCVNECPFAGITGSSGVSLRDWFAGQALAGLCSLDAVLSAKCPHDVTPKSRIKRGDDIATSAYRIADAMLAARENGSPDAR